MILDIFLSMDEFRKYAPGVEATLLEETIYPSFSVARKKITTVIDKAVYDAVIASSETDPKEYLKLALANYTCHEYEIFVAVSKNASDGKMYKYQIEDIKEKHLSMFWTGMDDLLTWLDDHLDTGDWKATKQYKERQELPLKNASEFSYYFNINNSGYFFSRVIFLIREIHEDTILPRIPDFGAASDKIKQMAMRALCYGVMARAVLIFDITELPESIRKDVAHEFTKSGSEVQSREKLYNVFTSKAEEYYQALDIALKDASGVLTTTVNHNKEEDKFYVIS